MGRARIRLLLAGTMMSAAAYGQTVTAVPQLAMKELVGTWYEVMRYPVKAQKKCIEESTVLYAYAEKVDRFSVVRTCPVQDSFIDVKNRSGRRQEKGGVDGRLKLRTIWPFYRKYDVVALGPDYGWAVMGTPNHKSLWVLSRTAKLLPEVDAEVRMKAKAAGFNVSRLVTPPPATGTGVQQRVVASQPRQ